MDNLRTKLNKMEEDKCDPLKSNITYCVYYGLDVCPKICLYATERKEKEAIKR